MPRDHSFAIYRFTSEPLDSALLVERVTRALERRLESDPENASLRLVTAGIFMNERLFSPAIRQLAAAERLSPGDPEIAVLQATAYQSAGDTAMCLVACQRATRLGLKTAFQHGEIGLVLYRLRDFAAAINQLSNAVRLEPSHALYLTALGSSHFQVGDYSRAARELERALSIVPAARQTRLQAAQAYALSRQPGRSLALIEAGRRTGVSSPQLDAFADSLRNSESSARVR
jgi:Flp pilus assembly protein TadD